MLIRIIPIKVSLFTKVKLSQVKSLVEEANSTKKEGYTAKKEGDEEQQMKFDAEYEMKMREMQTFRGALVFLD